MGRAGWWHFTLCLVPHHTHTHTHTHTAGTGTGHQGLFSSKRHQIKKGLSFESALPALQGILASPSSGHQKTLLCLQAKGNSEITGSENYPPVCEGLQLRIECVLSMCVALGSIPTTKIIEWNLVCFYILLWINVMFNQTGQDKNDGKMFLL
jgi:hypothetical protein